MAHEFRKFTAGSDERDLSMVSEAPVRLIINGEHASGGGVSKRNGFAEFPIELDGSGGEDWGTSSLLSDGKLWGVLRAWDFRAGKQLGAPAITSTMVTAGASTSIANGFRTSKAFQVHDATNLSEPHCAVATLDGVTYVAVVANRFGGDTLVTVVEAATGSVVLRSIITSVTDPQVVAVTTGTPNDTVLFHVYAREAGNTIVLYTYTLEDDGTFSRTSVGSVTTALTAGATYDTYGEGTTVLIAGRLNASNDLLVRRLDAAGATVVSISQAVTGAAPTVVHLEKDDAGAVHVAHCSGSGVNTGYLETFNSGLTARTFGSTAIFAGSALRTFQVCNIAGTTTLALIATRAPLYDDVLHNIVNTDHTGLGTERTIRSAHSQTQPISVRYGTTKSRPFIGCTFNNGATLDFTQQPTAVLLGIPQGAGQTIDGVTVPATNVEHSGVLWADNVRHRTGTSQRASVGYDASTGDYYVPITTVTTYDTVSAYGLTGVSVVRLSTGLGTASETVALPRTALQGTPYLGGALLRYFDGVSLGEVVPMPVQILSTAQGAGTNLAAGSYTYCVVIKWTDTQGRVHRSAPSRPVTRAHAGTNGVVVTAALDFATMLMGDVGSQKWQAELYRTAASGSTFYRVRLESFTPNVSHAFGEDSTNDTSLIDNELLYTTGGVLQNEQPPAALALTAHASRLWLVSAQDPTTLWCSKVLEEGYAPEFNPVLQVRLDEPAVALASMDEKLVAFTASGAYLITGEGPDALGAGSFRPPEPITGALGAVSHAAAVSTPLGVLVQARAGFQLVGRDLSVQDADLLSESWPETQHVTASVHLPDRQQVWFAYSGGARDLLVYDYSEGLRVYLWQIAMASVSFIRDLALVDSEGFLLVKHTAGDKVWEQDSGYDDGGVFVSLTVSSGWFVPDGWNGDCRFRQVAVLGETPNGAGECSVTVQVYVQRPNESNVAEVNNFTWASLESPGAPRFHRRDRLQHQRGCAAKVFISTASSGTADVAGPALTGVDWEYATRGAPAKQSPAKTST